LPENALRENARLLLASENADIEDALLSLIFENTVQMERCAESNHIYLSPFYYAEHGVCKRLLGLSGDRFNTDMGYLEERLGKFQQEEGIRLDKASAGGRKGSYDKTACLSLREVRGQGRRQSLSA
jgi:exodeoxyribonuclease V alpha subunit